MIRRRSQFTRLIAMTGAAVAAALGPAACSTPGPTPASDATRADGPTLDDVRRTLQQLAEREGAKTPDEPDHEEQSESLARIARAVPVPDLPTPGEHALQPLDEALEEFAARPVRSTSTPPPPPPAEHDRRPALEAYAAGREALIRGNPDTAIDLLERATELDPASPEAWRALGEAQLALGLQASAMVSFESAINLGLDEPRVLTLAGIDALARRQTDRAATLLARADRSTVPDADDGLDPVRRAALGEALIALGRLDAGATLIADAIEQPPQLSAPTRVPRELGTLFRRRPELWLLAGDAFAAVARTQRADAAYAAGLGLPGTDASAIAARRLALALAADRPALAATLVVDRLSNAGGLVGTRDVRLIAAIAEAGNDNVARALKDAVDAIDLALVVPSPTQQLGLARARAATRNAADRRRALLAALADHAFDSPQASTSLADDLVRTTPPVDARPLARTVADAIDAAPQHARSITLAAIDHTTDPIALTDQLIEDGPPLARDATLLALGRLADIDTAPDALPQNDGPVRTATAALLAEAAALTGRWSDAAAHRDALADNPTALLAALVAAQRTDVAADVASQILNDPAATAPALLAASDALRLTGRFDAALAAAERALEHDRHSEPAFERLLSLRGGQTPVADAPIADALARRLRDELPESRILRLLTARELIRRQLLDEATRRVEELATEDPLDPTVLEQQVALAQAIVRANRSPADIEQALRDTLDRHPGSAAATRALAIVIAADGRPDEAVATIERTIVRTNTHALDELLERALRDAGDNARADALRAERLAPAPRSIDATLEVAALVSAGFADQLADAIDSDTDPDFDTTTATAAPAAPAAAISRILTRGIPAEATLSDAQRESLSQTLVRTIARVPNEPNPNDAPALDLLDWAEARRVPLAAGMHGRRIAILGRTDAPTARVTAAVRSAAAEHPSVAADFVTSTIIALRNDSRMLDASRMIADLFLSDDTPFPESLRSPYVREMVSLASTALDTEGVRAFIDDLNAAGTLPAVLDVINAAPGEDRFAQGPAALAYTVAAFATFTADDVTAEPLYRLALSYDPGHVWAANDLGYQLLERGENEPDAERFIITAALGAPDQHNIIDSLGWLRYHQDKLETPAGTDPDDLANLGAVDLLQRAVELLEAQPERTDDGIIVDHLGDALARAGRTEEAVAAWATARVRANARLRDLALNQQTESPAHERVVALLRSITLKTRAAESGLTPPTPEPAFAPDPSN